MKCKYGCALDKGVIELMITTTDILREGMCKEEIKISNTTRENMICNDSPNGLHQSL